MYLQSVDTWGFGFILGIYKEIRKLSTVNFFEIVKKAIDKFTNSL